MKNLTTEEGRKQALKEIENSFLASLKANGVELSDNAVCALNGSGITIGVSATGLYAEKGHKMAFASEIELYAKRHYYDSDYQENQINFGSSGSFTPNDKESYWRIIHAASVLKNWNVVSDIVNTHCKMYNDLAKEIYEINNVQNIKFVNE
jgi:hypothetical protein